MNEHDRAGHAVGDRRKRIRELIALEVEAAERDDPPNIVLGED